MDAVLDHYFQAPPVTRTFTAITVVLSLGVILGALSDKTFAYYPLYVYKFPPEIWRCVTGFMITGSGMSFLFQSYHLYIYMSQLEVGNPRFSKTEDFIWYLMCVGGAILGINHLVGFPFPFFLDALILAMCYTTTQEQRGMKTKFLFMFTIPAQLLPYCLILFNLVFPGGAIRMILEIYGLIAAHLFDFLTKVWPRYGGNGRSLLPTPPLLATLVNFVSQNLPNLQARMAPAPAPESSSSGSSTGRPAGSSGGPLPDSWRTRGPGHRLG
uniref:Derlin n=1 Tax=Bionectria ochroleuca TaxID=29856 RepID=A0A8H7TSB2_BIOOC